MAIIPGPECPRRRHLHFESGPRPSWQYSEPWILTRRAARSLEWLRITGVVEREGFGLPTPDPDSGRIVGSISAHDFADELNLCGKNPDTCRLCAEEDDA